MTIYDFNFKEPFANGADSSEIQPFPDENRGLGIAFVQTDGKPEMKGLNGLFNKITKALLSVRQNGLLGWVDNIEYIQGGFVVEDQKLYQAKVNNTNRKPSESQSDWSLWTNASDISVDSNGNIEKTTNPNGTVNLKVFDSTTSKKGVVRAATATEVANKSNVNAYVAPSNVALISQSTDIGVGQTWQNMTASRSSGSTYINNTGKPITVIVSIRDANIFSGVLVYVGGVVIIDVDDIGAQGTTPYTFIVPSNTSYLVNVNSNTIRQWSELR